MGHKVYGGTPNFSSKCICVTCRHGQFMRNVDGQETTLCRAGGYSEPFVVVHAVTLCNTYEDKRTPPMWEMEKIAWRITVDKEKQQIGFGAKGPQVDVLSPAQFREKFPDED